VQFPVQIKNMFRMSQIRPKKEETNKALSAEIPKKTTIHNTFKQNAKILHHKKKQKAIYT
jgi:hypothetical protein